MRMSKIDMRNQKRRDVVAAIVNRQEPIHEVARIFNVPQRTVFDWLAWFRAEGWNGLNEKRRSGRPRKLSGAQIKWVYDCITLGHPQQFNFEFCLWTLKMLRDLIRSRLKVELSTSSLSRLLRKLGLSAQRPVYQAYRKDPARAAEYLNATFPAAMAKAKALDARVFFVDESAIRSDAHRGTTWGAVGETPVVRDSGGRFGMNLISAVSPRGDLRFSVIGETMDSARFIAFLKQLHRDAGGPILVVVDNAKYHHSRETRRFVEQQEGQIQLVYLPPYSPELNPDEQVWNHAKREIGKRTILNKTMLERVVLGVMRSLQKKKDLVRSFFQLPGTRYILDAIN